jgi:hypothetical protein
MTLFSKLKKLVALVFIASILFNCSGKSESAADTVTPKNHSKVAKPGAPVTLVSDSRVVVNAGQPTKINVELKISERQTNELDGYLEINFVSSQGLDILETATYQRVNLTNTPIIFPVTLHAYTDGRYYLNLHIHIENGGSVSSRVLAVIVQVGAESDERIQFKKTSGENIISLPAQEKISTK